MISIDLITDFFLFLFIGTGSAYFQIFLLKRDFPGKIFPALAVSLVGSFAGSLAGSFFLSQLPVSSLWVLAGSALVFSTLFLQLFYTLSRIRDYY